MVQGRQILMLSKFLFVSHTIIDAPRGPKNIIIYPSLPPTNTELKVQSLKFMHAIPGMSKHCSSLISLTVSQGAGTK